MDWSKGFSARFYLTEVDPATWRDIDRIEILGGNIKRETSGLMQSADVDCKDIPTGLEKWVRVWADARQASDWSHEPLFTGLSITPEKQIQGTFYTCSLQCYSVLKPADDVLLDRGWYAPQGFNGAELCRDLLKVCPCPVEIEGISPTLASSIIAEDGETRLTMVHKIMTAIGWRILISGNGTVKFCEQSSDWSARFSTLDNDVVEPQITLASDWYDCPNVFRAISDDLTAVARDDSEDSPLSTVNRGREVWMEDTNADLNDGESIAEYAQRRLKEEQAHGTQISYRRRYDPNVFPSDTVLLNFPRQEILGEYKVKSQTLTLGYGISVDEEVIA